MKNLSSVKEEPLVADMSMTPDRLQENLSRRDFKEVATDPTGGCSAHEMLAMRIFFHKRICILVYVHMYICIYEKLKKKHVLYTVYADIRACKKTHMHITTYRSISP